VSSIESAPSWGSSLVVPSGSRDTRVRERVSTVKLGAVCLGHRVSQPTLGPLGQPEKALGHESPIEPWLALDHRSALRVLGLMASLRQVMKTAGRRNPNRWVTAPDTPSPWRGRSEFVLDQMGWEARKTPAVGEVFFLDFPLYRTSQAVADLGLRFPHFIRYS